MTTKRARLRKSGSALGITQAKTHNTRARRKAATAKTTALTNRVVAAARKAATAPPAKAASPLKVVGTSARKKKG